MNTKHILLALACAGLATSIQANTVTFDSTVWGTGGDLGVTSKTFTSGGVSLQVASTDGTTDLYAKNGGGDETGLGLNIPPQFELLPSQGITVLVPTGGLLSMTFGSVQSGEQALVYYGATPGSKTTAFAPVTADGSLNVSVVPAGDYISIFGGGSGGANILIDTIVANGPTVPDGGTTLALLGGALSVLGIVRRKLVA